MQNPDGGWGFQGKSSWTEPSAFVLLALGLGGECDASQRTAKWLIASQRQDGGWGPQPAVDVSTWLTSLVTLSLLPHQWPEAKRQQAFDCLQKQIQPSESLFFRVLSRLNGQPIQDVNHFGRSWYPGTAAWVYPTAIAVITFLQLERLTGSKTFGDLGRKGQAYLLSRRCNDGGWNHGGAHLANEEPFSYPEMTGLVLLALGGVPGQELSPAFAKARQFIADPASGEGLSWLQLGLAKHGISALSPPTTFPCRQPREIALRLLALSADNPRNLLVSPHSL